MQKKIIRKKAPSKNNRYDKELPVTFGKPTVVHKNRGISILEKRRKAAEKKKAEKK